MTFQDCQNLGYAYDLCIKFIRVAEKYDVPYSCLVEHLEAGVSLQDFTTIAQNEAKRNKTVISTLMDNK